MSNCNRNSSIFVWQSSISAGITDCKNMCRWCQTNTLLIRNWEGHDKSYERDYLCPLCGWSYFEKVKMSSSSTYRYDSTMLREFQSDDSADAFSELRSIAKNNIGDIYRLDWVRFEELTQNVFKNIGYRIVLARQSIATDCNVILLSNDKEICLVKCSKDFDDEVVKMENVGSLIGVLVDWKYSAASLVTSEKSRSEINFYEEIARMRSYDFELSDISDFLRCLGCLNERTPKLAGLNVEARQGLINDAKARYQVN